MLENMIWQVEANRVPSDLADRTVRIQVKEPYREALTWGLNTHYPLQHVIEKEPVAIRDTTDGDTVLIAIVDTPFIVELWDTDADESIGLEWTGTYWNTTDTDHLNTLFHEDEMTEYRELRVIDVGVELVKVCHSIGLGHLEVNDAVKSSNYIGLIHRDNLRNNLSQGSYFYRGMDYTNSHYTSDVVDLPPRDELDFLQFIDNEDPGASFILFLYDDDLSIESVIKKMITNQNITVKVITSNSTDIVDIKDLVKNHIVYHDGEPTNIFIVESGNEEKRYNLFFNMATYNPDIAPYLTTYI